MKRTQADATGPSAGVAAIMIMVGAVAPVLLAAAVAATALIGAWL